MKDNNTDPLHILTMLVDKYNSYRDNMTVEEVQDLRENMSLNLFYLSSDIAKAISNYESKDYERKRKFAEIEESYRSDTDPRTGKIYTVADSERMARIQCKDIEVELSEALRQKERARVILTAVQQILNALSSKITILKERQNG